MSVSNRHCYDPLQAAVLSHTAFHVQSLSKLLMAGYCADDVFYHVAPLCHIGVPIMHVCSSVVELGTGLVCWQCTMRHGLRCLTFCAHMIAGGLSLLFAVLMAGGQHVFPFRFNAAAMVQDLDRHQVRAPLYLPANMSSSSL